MILPETRAYKKHRQNYTLFLMIGWWWYTKLYWSNGLCDVRIQL